MRAGSLRRRSDRRSQTWITRRDCFEAREKVMQVAGVGREHGDVAVTCDASRGDGH